MFINDNPENHCHKQGETTWYEIWTNERFTERSILLQLKSYFPLLEIISSYRTGGCRLLQYFDKKIFHLIEDSIGTANNEKASNCDQKNFQL